MFSSCSAFNPTPLHPAPLNAQTNTNGNGAKIPYRASNSTVAAALLALPPVMPSLARTLQGLRPHTSLEVAFASDGGGGRLCSADGTSATITFLRNAGSLPPIVILPEDLVALTLCLGALVVFEIKKSNTSVCNLPSELTIGDDLGRCLRAFVVRLRAELTYREMVCATLEGTFRETKT